MIAAAVAVASSPGVPVARAVSVASALRVAVAEVVARVPGALKPSAANAFSI
jgi:hypothetical protein